MKFDSLRFLAFPLLFLMFLIDSQLSTIFSVASISSFSISSHLLLLVGLYMIDVVPLPSSVTMFFLLGVIYDQYYLNILGIATTILPLLLFIVYHFYRSFNRSWILDLLVFLLMIFYFEFVSYIFARIFHLTNLSIFIFTFYNLLPSLLVNTGIFCVLRPVFQRFFDITYKT
ncbi:TPA: rod shape-determining protein MreD [Streptococcus suis]|nr:rod shape-determining protein MreD [Streptococcus suis]NQN52277.1 rod shape-determining protein MreD [Streptococcus suis]NQN91521.1 rod shape-determining protein MreD [Streptococcus suis]NQP59329.1 rod shape-determining protein MreD [Streptococcus suis]HEM3177190.1 rod shape-determining protein MreD [Streptococcus suis]